MTKTTRKPAAKTATKPQGKIVSSTGVMNGEKHLIKADDGRELLIPTARWVGNIRNLSAVGASMDQLEAAWAKANVTKMAAGVDSRNSPHTAKAVADNKAAQAKGKAPAKSTRTATGARKATAPVTGETRKYAEVKSATKDMVMRAGSWTEYMVQTALAHKDTASANAALAAKPFDGKARRIDWNWLANVRGYIKFA